MTKTATPNPKHPSLTQRIVRDLRHFIASPLALGLILTMFVVQASFLALTVHIGTPPDEVNHIEFIKYYEHHSLSPVFTHQQPTYYLGDKTREVDYLYHYTMSLVVRVLPFSSHTDFLIVRLLSVVFALLAFIFFAKSFRLLGVPPGVIAVALLVMTNLPMVLMMGSAVNNDVMVWLGMALGIWLLLKLWRRPSLLYMVWLADLVLLGGLVKRTILPVFMVVGLLGLAVLWRHYRHFLGDLTRPNWRLCLALVVFVVALGLFTERIGGNIVRYGGITVTCEQVHGVDACKDFWLNIRADNLAAQPKPPLMSGLTFVGRWFGESFYNVVDIQTQGWRHAVQPAPWLTPPLVILLAAGLAYGCRYEAKRLRRDPISRQRTIIGLIALGFIFVQLVVNFGSYRRSHVFGLALNGRYILPSLFPLAILAGFYWSQLLRRRPSMQVILALLAVAGVIVGSGLYMMVRNPQLFTA